MIFALFLTLHMYNIKLYVHKYTADMASNFLLLRVYVGVVCLSLLEVALAFHSKVIALIRNCCNLHTLGNHCVKYKHLWSKKEEFEF